METLITDKDTVEIFIRITVAMFLGITLGAERIMARKTAGMRTYALVSMGAAVFVILSMIVADLYIDNTSVGPLRAMSQVIVGIGFIGAGLIIFKGDTISGLTTAAGLWVAAGIGMASGYGLYSIAIFITILTLFIFTVLWRLENKVKSVAKGYFFDHDGIDDD
jgi:putative Mg2+ transporter-C (MgtC) family protein